MSKWADVEPHVGHAIGMLGKEIVNLVTMILDESEASERKVEQFLEQAKEKYERGNAEHNDAWADWDQERFVQECRDEILDAVIYLAMMRSQQKGNQ